MALKRTRGCTMTLEGSVAIYLSPMQKKKRNPAASHIFISTLFHFNKDLSKIILAVCPIDNWLLRIKLIIKANYLVAEPIWLVPLRFICEVIITVWPTTTYWFSTSLKVSINHEGYSYWVTESSHCCPALCPENNTLPRLYGATIVLLRSTYVGPFI